jgi:type II secretory ATPase GspE/PulE/Tfp pilus assembly ATPase PilB-like protein
LPAFQTTVSDDEKGNRNEFADAIKSMLRRDPDVGFVGELRDEMSASACASGVQTGHTMISTVHAQSGIEIVERLASPAMKLAPETIGAPSFINALVFQMLIPLLDQETKIRLTKSNLNDYMDERQRDRFLRLFPDFDSKNMYVRGKSPQNPEGLKGMSICAEVVIPDDYMRTCFRKMELAEALNYWRRLGAKDMHKPLDERITGLTAADVAIAKTEAGLVDPRDLEGRFGHLDLLANKRQALLEMFKKSEAA